MAALENYDIIDQKKLRDPGEIKIIWLGCGVTGNRKKYIKINRINPSNTLRPTDRFNGRSTPSTLHLYRKSHRSLLYDLYNKL